MREGEVFRRAFLACEERINAAGLKVEIMNGPWEWRAFMEEQTEKAKGAGEKPPYVSSSFDPERDKSLYLGNVASIVCFDAGKTYAAIAVRCYENTLGHLIENAGLWMPWQEAMRKQFIPATLPADCPLDAPVAQRGGLWVDPEYRHRKIGSALSDASLAAAFRLFSVPYVVGLRRQDYDPHSANVAYLGKAEIGTPECDFWLTWCSRAESSEYFSSMAFWGHQPRRLTVAASRP